MKLIKHMIFVDLDSENKLLINSLNGKMNEISNQAHSTLEKWQAEDRITPTSDEEADFFDNLQASGYLVNSEEEEIAQKNKILDELREQYHLDRARSVNLTFILTYDCNFRCPYCFEEDACANKDVMTPDLIDAAFKLTDNSLRYIGFFGGEPLLPKTRKAIEYIIKKAPNAMYDMFTNGYYLEEFFDVFHKIRHNSLRIVVTIDGEEETHNARRFLDDGKPTYKKIVAGIKKYLDNGIPINVRINLDHTNLEESKRVRASLLDMCEHNKLLTFELAPLMGKNNAYTNKTLDELYKVDVSSSPEDIERNNRSLIAQSPIINSLISGKKMSPLYNFCYAHNNKLAVDPYGNIYSCLITVGRDKFITGKYYPEIEIKQNSIHNRNIDSIPECRECIYSLLCGGGCPVGLSQSDDVMKPQCKTTRNQIHNLLPMYYKTLKAAKCKQ